MTVTRRCIAASLFILIVSGCASTRLTSVWKDPKYKGPGVSSVLVIAVTAKEDRRRLFEKTMAGALTEAGVRAVVSSELLPAMRQLDRSDIKQAAMDSRVDSVIVTHLVGIENKEVYQPPIYDSNMYNSTAGLGTYYAIAYNYVSYPGAVYDRTEVRLETNLYRTESEALLWHASSMTVDPKSVGGAIQDLTAALVERLKNSGLLKTS